MTKKLKKILATSLAAAVLCTSVSTTASATTRSNSDTFRGYTYKATATATSKKATYKLTYGTTCSMQIKVKVVLANGNVVTRSVYEDETKSEQITYTASGSNTIKRIAPVYNSSDESLVWICKSGYYKRFAVAAGVA